MPLAEYSRLDATALAALVRQREVSACELLETAIAEIERLNPRLNAVVHPFFDKGQEAIAAGLPANSPFEGVPFLLKNTGLDVAGTPLTTGSRLFEDSISQADGTLTARYRKAGLVLIGKTNTPEFALSFTTEPLLFGAARNPWDTSRSPGGSSGGSAAAVASSMIPFAHASDGAGSTRVPASHCGVFGFKPSRGRNPLGPVVFEGIGGMSTPHAVSRSVRDSAALLDATAGPDIGDPYEVAAPERPFLSELERDPCALRIGLVLDSPVGGAVDPQITAAVREAAALCESMGHHVEEQTAAWHDADALKAAWRVIVGVNVAGQVAFQAQRRGIADPLSLVEPVNRAWIAEGRHHGGGAYLQAINQLHRTARALGQFFQRFDLLLSPTTAELPPPLGRLAAPDLSLDAFYERFWDHAPFTAAFNASGYPAMSVPFAQSREGLPIGAHFGAGFGQDGLLFALAGQLERARPWAHRRPELCR